MTIDHDLRLAMAAALDRFGLGTPVEPPRAVPEAWSNHVFAVRTESGRYALKLFEHDAGPELRTPMAIESAALRTGQIPMAEPVPVAGAGLWLAELHPAERRWWARCHHWVAGERSSIVEPTGATVRDVGRSVAALHALRLDGGDTSQLPAVDLERWHRAVGAAVDSDVEWSADLAGLTPLIEGQAGRLDQLRAERRPMWMSHRDLDPKNAVLRPDGRVVLTDWDYAGPALLGVELVVAAVSFAGGLPATDGGLVREFVEAYRSHDGDAEPVDPLAIMSHVALEDIPWLLRNVEGYLEPTPGEDIALRGRLAGELIASFRDSLNALEASAREVRERW